MDKKETLLINQYKNKFKNNTFTETDIYGFLILIRNYINKHNTSYKYILEFCDLVAHRKRNKGLIMNAIIKTIENNYQINKKGKLHADLITEIDWKRQWIKLSESLKLDLTDRNIDEITMSIYSLAAGTVYDNKDSKKKNEKRHKGKVEILKDENNNLYIGIGAERRDSKFIVFSKYPCKIKNFNENIYDGLLIGDKNNNLIIKGRD